MNFISLCSGIEAASVAFGPLGWKAIAFSEIEGFPSAVLAHHYPTVRNYGDMSLFRDWPDELFADADAIVGGPPCQAFSMAGARRGLNDARGNLTLIYVDLLNHADAIRSKYGKPPVVALYENVPGIFSDRTNAFGCLVGGLAGEDVPVFPPGKRWTDAGCVLGPERAVAWRLLDAQFFALAQRRRRVFVVASARKGFDPATVLFEWDGVRRDTAPSREARQVAPTIPARSTAGGGLGTDFDCDGGTICVATGQAGAEIGADMAPTLNCNHEAPYVAHSLRGEGFDASEDGTGRGTPLVPMFLHANKGRPAGRQSAHTEMVSVKPIVETLTTDGHAQSAVAVPVAFDTTQITSAANRSNPQPGDACHPLAAGAHAPAIAFPANLSGTQCASTEELAPSMGSANPTAVAYGIRTANTSSNGWGIQEECTHTLDCAQGVAVAFQERGRTDGPSLEIGGDVAYALTAPNGGGRAQERNVLTPAMQVRRLTPTEAERLMGFPDGYTAIPWRGKPADQCPDGPRYRSLGNSWAIPNVRWIGQRIDAAVRRLR